ncbi:MAG TPA: extracellular solute-binding protein, partial [Polyangiaceae bacterium]|nr:extracellular solute-binding protein [Polyangiaceae bacterium]
GWLRALNLPSHVLQDFLPAPLESARFEQRLYALPWFVDVGMLYYRKDWFATAPATFSELFERARQATDQFGAREGFVFTGARYEGLTTVFVEVLGGFGGSILTPDSRASALDSPAALGALSWLTRAVQDSRVSPRTVLSSQEEQVRFEFQSGRAAFMRNWPYAYALMQRDPSSAVRGKVGIAPMPHEVGGSSTAALGGQQLAINVHSRSPELAQSFIEFACRPEQMLERAEIAAELPARRSVYEDPRLPAALAFPVNEILPVVERATARPTSPAYSELSSELQIQLHAALTQQLSPRAALRVAHERVTRVIRATGSPAAARSQANHPSQRWPAWLWLVLGSLVTGGILGVLGRRPRSSLGGAQQAREQRLGSLLIAPTLLCVVLLTLVPLWSAIADSLHAHDLRKPWLGRPFVGLANYSEVFGAGRFWGALVRTTLFTLVSVSLELVAGLAGALLLARTFRGRGLMRALALLPWALPTVVVALTFRFLFDSRSGPVHLLVSGLGLIGRERDWFSDELLAWIPILLADVWKTSPFVTLLLLSGLSSIPPSVYEAAALDGATRMRQLWYFTLPMLRQLIYVVVLLRALDAFRVFDLIYVLTQGGPGIATEPLAIYTHQVLLRNLDFGHGAALSVVIFAFTLALCALALLLMRRKA